MAVISRGQITIVDLNDGKSINLYLGSNVATTQIFNKENSSYVPNWTLSPFLVVTPEVYVTGVATNQISRLKGIPVCRYYRPLRTHHQEQYDHYRSDAH
ncbi:MAG: hypothetical protein RR559_11570 [Bacteroides sp.]